MEDAQIRKLLEADLAALASKAQNPRATLQALSQKVEAAIAEVDRQLTELDLKAMELPAQLDAELQKLGKLDAVIAKARQDARPDLEQAATARKTAQAAKVAELEAETGRVDARSTELQTLREQLEARQVELSTAIAAAPPDAKVPAVTPTPAASPVAATTVTPVPVAKAAPAATRPAAGKPDPTEDEFAALFASMNMTLDDVKLPPKKNAPAPLPSTDDLGIPDLVSVSADELPEDATDEDRAPIPTAPPKNATMRGNPVKGAAAPAAKPAPAPAKAAPAAPGKAAAPSPIANVPKPGAPASAARPATPAAPEAPAKSRALLWTTLLVVVGGTGAAYAHFVMKLF